MAMSPEERKRRNVECTRRFRAANREHVNAQARGYYAKDPEKAKAVAAKWRAANPEEARRRSNESGAKWRENHRELARRLNREYNLRRRTESPEKYKAGYMVRNAIVQGVLRKPDECSTCGEEYPPLEIHAHHEDYDRPLDVIWLCRPCHKALHRKKWRDQKDALEGSREDNQL